jgi:hypothetical protein
MQHDPRLALKLLANEWMGREVRDIAPLDRGQASGPPQ